MKLIRKKSSISMEQFSSLILPMIERNIDVTITVTGNSMYPLWRNNRDSVVLTNCDKFNLKRGSIPLYRRSSGQYVLHRIVRVNVDSYDMCGDAQYSIERNLPKENIIGIVRSFIRNGKEYSCSSFSFRVYTIIWLQLLPLRKLSMKIYRKLRGIIK